MKTIGVIAGMSWQSSIEYYRLINEGVRDRLGAHSNAKSLMVSVNFEDIEPRMREGRWDEIGEILACSARQLEAGGADFILLCTNTMHKRAEDVEAAVTIPFVHIVDVTAEAIRVAGFNRVGLLATRFTMEQPFYRDRFARHGIELLVPCEDDRNRVHAAIFDELVHGVFAEATRVEFLRIIEGLAAEGAEGVILGCTEIPLLIRPEHSSLPVFDTTRIHAARAVEMAMA